MPYNKFFKDRFYNDEECVQCGDAVNADEATVLPTGEGFGIIRQRCVICEECLAEPEPVIYGWNTIRPKRAEYAI